MPSSTSDTTPSKASSLAPRYEISRLTREHSTWAAAIVIHSNIFCSPVWTVIYPDQKTARASVGQEAGSYLINHQIDSGMSFGVFDLEYNFKQPESSATGGVLYWDYTDTTASSDKLLQQMDFPLVNVALAYDQINALDMFKIEPLVQVLPLFGTVYHLFDVLDKRDKSWVAKAPREVLMRNATSTRREYEGKGLMKKLAIFLMREAKEHGFRAINIETLNDAVSHVWLNPPKPFASELVVSVDIATYEDVVDGVNVKPFAPSTQVGNKIYVTLQDNKEVSSGRSAILGLCAQHMSCLLLSFKACSAQPVRYIAD